MSSNPSPRRRGAPPGNLNALKHGFYARNRKPVGGKDLVAAEFFGLEEEIAMLRAFIRQVYATGIETNTFSESRALLRVLCLASGSLNRLLLTQHWLAAGKDELPVIDKHEFMESLLQLIDRIDEEISYLDPRWIAEGGSEGLPDISPHDFLNS